jgi:hypothetical protein
MADQSLLASVNCQELYRETAHVRLKIGVRLPDGSRPYLDPLPSGKGKLKPLFAFVDREPEHHREGVYFLRYAREGKRIWEHSVRIGSSRLKSRLACHRRIQRRTKKHKAKRTHAAYSLTLALFQDATLGRATRVLWHGSKPDGKV